MPELFNQCVGDSTPTVLQIVLGLTAEMTAWDCYASLKSTGYDYGWGSSAFSTRGRGAV